jgi:hypothetical protein
MNMTVMNMLCAAIQIIFGFVMVPFMMELQFIDSDSTTPPVPTISPSPLVPLPSSATGGGADGWSDGLPMAAVLFATASTAAGAGVGGGGGLGIIHHGMTSTGPMAPAWASPQGTDTVSRNMFANIGHGFRCIFGLNSEWGDICQSLGPTVSVELLLYFLCIIGTQIALLQVNHHI